MQQPGGDLRVAFLDVDGVPLEEPCVDNLKWLVSQNPNTRVVLSTTWWLQPHLKSFLVDTLSAKGIAVLGQTDDLFPPQSRGAEVRAWLRKHNEEEGGEVVAGYVVQRHAGR